MPKFIKIPATTIPIPEQNWIPVKVEFDYTTKVGRVTLFNGDISQFSLVDNSKILIKEVPFIDVLEADEQILVDVAVKVDVRSEVLEEAPIRTTEDKEAELEARDVSNIEP